jgi:hypothetical protein
MGVTKIVKLCLPKCPPDVVGLTLHPQSGSSDGHSSKKKPRSGKMAGVLVKPLDLAPVAS